MSRGVYRDGQVYVMARLCDTCIFRPGNLMQLEPGRVESIVAECEKHQACIPCHKTTFAQTKGEAVCRGFFELHATAPLQIADRLGYVKFVDLNSLARGRRLPPAASKG